MKRVSLRHAALIVGLGWSLVSYTAPLTARASSQTVAVETPLAYKNKANGMGRHGASVAFRDWWTLFGDPELTGLEEQTLAANQDLRQAVARIDEARQSARVAAAGFFPHAELDIYASRLRTTGNGPVQSAELAGPGAAAFGAGPGGQPPVFSSRLLSNTFNDFRMPLVVSYEVDIFGRIRHQYGSARATLLAVRADQKAVELGLTSEVASNYFMLRALDSQVAVLQRGVELRREAVKLNQERVTAGLANDVDLSRARVELDNTQADLDDAIRMRAEIENNIAALCGTPASEFHIAPKPLEDLKTPAIPAGVPSQLLVQRPDLIEAQYRLASATEQIGVARANMLPTFNIQGQAGYESAQFNRLVDDQSHTWEITGSVSIPIFEGGRNLANFRAAKARREQALAAYRSTAINAFKEVENALADLKQRAAQMEARDRATHDAATVLDLSHKRYIEGAVNYFEVVDAQRTLLNAELTRVQTLNGRFSATVALIRALGGSWSTSGLTAVSEGK